jgi:hypothetical protein
MIYEDVTPNSLPITSNIGSIKITNSYHNIFRLTRIGDSMANSLIPVFQCETSFPQVLADINTDRAGAIEYTSIKS